MGIPRPAVSLLFELKRDTKFNGVICQLGRQSVFVTFNQMTKIRQSFDINPSDYEHANVERTATSSVVDDVCLFKFLGFDRVESIDYSEYEDPTHILDLNLPVPEEFYGKYDAIYDGGTLEHIFNFPQCLKNIHCMLKLGGFIMHASPSNNFIDHGFYMFSPTVFYDYYFSNKYDILRSNIFECDGHQGSWTVYDYREGETDISYFNRRKKQLMIWFCARKNDNSTCDVIPQQSSCTRAWNEFKNMGKLSNTKKVLPPNKVKFLLKKNKYVFKFAKYVYRFFVKLKKPRIIARY